MEQTIDEEDAFMNMSKKKSCFDFLKRHECPTVPIQQNFNISKFMGRWYESHRSRKLGRKHRECNTNNFSRRDDGLIDIVSTSTQM